MAPVGLLQTAFVAVAGAVTVTAMVSSPLLGTPTAELATFLAAAWGPGWLVTSAAVGARRDKRGFGADLLAQAIWMGCAACACMTLASLRALATHSCSPSPGVWTMAVLTLPAWCFNITVGLWIGRLVGRVKTAILLSVLGLICYALWQIALWRDWPSFGVASHLSVVMTADLTQGFVLSHAVVAFRCATLLFALSLGGLGVWCFPSERAHGFLALAKPSAAVLAAAIPLYLFAWLVQAHSLKHIVPSRQGIAQEYRQTVRAGPLVLHHPETIPAPKAAAFLQEARLWLEVLQERLGIVPRQELHIWLHPDRNAQQKHTGARHVDFAAMGHMHITATSIPHPTLGHELAHLLVGQLATTIWGIPGKWGLVPNVGLHEGLAVAVTHELAANDGMTLWQQAAAMHQAGLAPPLDQLFALAPWAFWQQAAGPAYTFAGAAVWLLLRHARAEGGSLAAHAAVRKLVRHGSPRAAFEDPEAYATFRHEWQLLLRHTPLPKHALASARQRFSGNGILRAVCDPLEQQARQHMLRQAREGDWGGVWQRLTQNALARTDSTPWLQLAGIAQERDEPHEQLNCLRQALARVADRRQETEATEELGDALWRLGHGQAAVGAWSLVDPALLERYGRRRIAVKQTLAQDACGPRASPAAVQALHLLTHVGDRNLDARYASLAQALKKNEQQCSSARTLQTLRGKRWISRRRRYIVQNIPTDERENKQGDAIPRYLLARYLLRKGLAEEALWQLHQVAQISEELPPLVAAESWRLLAAAAAKAGRLPLAIQVYQHLEQQAITAADRSVLALELRRLRLLLAQREVFDGVVSFEGMSYTDRGK